MNIPILFTFFVKDTAKIVFESIRKNKPPRLYLASDGPRTENLKDKEKVIELRNYILKNIDWKCEVKTLFRDKNLGCRLAMSQAITWFFENEEMGMIIEDDILPIDSAFSYCEELLLRFKDEKKVGMITCFNPISYKTRDLDCSYFFSKYSAIWGWGTWRDRWAQYDVNMSKWPEWKKNGGLKKISKGNKLVEMYWGSLLDFIFTYDKSIWDPQWSFLHFKNGWLTVVPSKNQIRNIGYNSLDAVNCNNPEPDYLKKSVPETLSFPLIHPEKLEVSDELDRYIEKEYYGINLLKIFAFYFKVLLVKIASSKGIEFYRKIKNVYYKIFG